MLQYILVHLLAHLLATQLLVWSSPKSYSPILLNIIQSRCSTGAWPRGELPDDLVNKGPFEWPENDAQPVEGGQEASLWEIGRWNELGKEIGFSETHSPPVHQISWHFHLNYCISQTEIQKPALQDNSVAVRFRTEGTRFPALKVLLVDFDASWLRMTNVMFAIQLQMVPD